MKKPRLKTIIILGGFFFCVFSLITLNCSGLLLPLFGVQDNLNGSLKKDFGLSLPASAKVQNGVFVAQRDESEFFKVQMDPKDIAPFMAALEAAGRASLCRVEDSSIDKRVHFGRPGPAWYEPEKLPDLISLKLNIPMDSSGHGGTGYWFFFSPFTGQLFIFWYET